MLPPKRDKTIKQKITGSEKLSEWERWFGSVFVSCGNNYAWRFSSDPNIGNGENGRTTKIACSGL